MSNRYTKSELLLRDALDLFPTGTQTAMKSSASFPLGISPFFAQKAHGSRIWDVDGNEYVDFVGALGPITLGYNDPDVIAAVSEQLKVGTIFSLSHSLEIEVARLLRDMIPCCEMVRFGKNGSDMTSASIRLARSITGREHVAQCGYHGWNDWSIAMTPQNSGVPKAVCNLSHVFKYNDLDSLEVFFRENPNNVAAVIMEPMRVIPPANGFLTSVRELCTKHGTVFIFDEIVTGFRYANGGAQELFSVTPDLAIFAKGMSNGFPLSALVGRRDFMKQLTKVHVSLTNGGETLSLAAAKATLEKYNREPVIDTIKLRGKRLLNGVIHLVVSNQLEEVFVVGGSPALPFLLPREGLGFSEPEIRTYFLQEMFEHGFLVLGAHVISYAHTETDIDSLLAAYGDVLPKLAIAIREKTLTGLLKVNPPKHSTTNWR
ncbi:MAG: aspartate aminotransferase family protein [Thermoguttaceae bacterium]